MLEWAVKLEAKPKYVVSSTRKDFPWTNSHHIAGDLRTGVQKLKDATPAGVLLGSGQSRDRAGPAGSDRRVQSSLVHPRIAGHGPTLYQSGLPSTRRLEAGLGEAAPQRRGRHALPARADLGGFPHPRGFRRGMDTEPTLVSAHWFVATRRVGCPVSSGARSGR